MLRIGLTGGIAAGKSVVARRLEELGAVLVDADVLARQVVEPGSEGLRAVVDAFGQGLLAGDRSLDRPALGRLIFGDAEARERLNAIVHPRVRRAAAQLVAAAAPDAVVVEDIPLLVETGQAPRFHVVVVVDAPETQRIRRMVEDRGMDVREAEQRIAAQVAGPERLREADAILVNSGTTDELLASTEALWYRRLVPFAENLAAGVPAGSGAGQGPQDPALALLGTSGLARRTAARIRAALPDGTDASFETVGGHPQDDTTALVLRMAITRHDASRTVIDPDADGVRGALEAAGYPRIPGDPAGRHRGADPATPVTIAVTRSHPVT